MRIRRSAEMWLVAYFLSRCGQEHVSRRTPIPPRQLQVGSWEEAYALFYLRLNGGRSFSAFYNSMKNTRDMFDGHLNSGRVGWRKDSVEREPQPLNRAAQDVMDKWQGQADDALWNVVRQHTDIQARGLSVKELERLASTSITSQ